MWIAIPVLLFMALLANTAIRGGQRSSRVGAFLALAAVLILTWGYIALAYAMNDDPSRLPLLLAAAFGAVIVILGFFAFQRKAL